MEAQSREGPMRIGAVAVVGLMIAAGAQAQTSPRLTKAAASQSQATVAIDFRGACPGQLVARQQSTGGATVWTTALEDKNSKDAGSAKPNGLGIHVEFTGAKTAVKALELNVSYLPLGLRSMPATTQLTNGVERLPQEQSKTFNLDREAATRIGGDLLVGPAATITHVRLMSATFADGSVWNAASDDACSIVPSKYMLVEAKK
jgi:hypothetical protein